MAVLAFLAGVAPALAGAAASLDERLEQAAASAAREQVAAPDRFEVLTVRPGGHTPLAEGAVGIELVEAERPNASGISRVRFRLRVDGAVAGEARASVRGTVRGPAVVVRATLRSGERIPADAVAVEEVELTRFVEPVLRDPALLDGRVPVRTLGPGRVITADLLKTEPLVRRGDVVDVVVRRGPLLLRTRGVAQEEGAEGDAVRVENPRSGAQLLARVRADGSLRVERGPIAGSRR